METRYPRPSIWFRLPVTARMAPPAFPMVTNVELAVTKFNTKMSLGSPEGAWSITFVSTPEGVTPDDLAKGILPAENEFLTGQSLWYNKIDKMTLLGIAMGSEKPYFHGLVTDKRRGFQLVQDRPVASVTLSGIALGGIFNRQNVMYFPTITPGVNTAYGFLANTAFGERPWMIGDTKMRMDTIIHNLFVGDANSQEHRTSFSMVDIRFLNPDGSLGGSLWDYFDFDSYISTALRDLNTTKLDYLKQFSGTLWGVVKEFAPSPFFEVWFDTDQYGEKVALHARVPPFSFSDSINGKWANRLNWNLCLNPGTAVPFTEIRPEEITGIDLGESSSESFSIFYINPVGQNIGTNALMVKVPPLLSQRLCAKYGVRAYQADMPFLSYDPTEKNVPDIFQWASEWRNRVAEWYLLNDVAQSGTLDIKGRTDVRIGHKINVRGLPEGSRQFYVEEVSQDWSLNNPWVTKLTVTRGSTKDQRVAAHKEMLEMVNLASKADAAYAAYLRGTV